MTRPYALPRWLSLSIGAASLALTATLASAAAVSALPAQEAPPQTCEAPVDLPALRAAVREAVREEIALGPPVTAAPATVAVDRGATVEDPAESRLADAYDLLEHMRASEGEVAREDAAVMHSLVSSLPLSLAEPLLDEWLRGVNEGRIDASTLRP